MAKEFDYIESIVALAKDKHINLLWTEEQLKKMNDLKLSLIQNSCWKFKRVKRKQWGSVSRKKLYKKAKKKVA